MSIAYLCLYLALFSCVYHSLCICFPSFSFFVFFLRSFSLFRVYFSRALSPSLFRSIALSHTLFLEDFFSFCLLCSYFFLVYMFFCILNLHYQYVQYSCISKLYICTSKPAGMVLLKNTELFKENNVPNVPLY